MQQLTPGRPWFMTTVQNYDASEKVICQLPYQPHCPVIAIQAFGNWLVFTTGCSALCWHDCDVRLSQPVSDKNINRGSWIRLTTVVKMVAKSGSLTWRLTLGQPWLTTEILLPCGRKTRTTVYVSSCSHYLSPILLFSLPLTQAQSLPSPQSFTGIQRPNSQPERLFLKKISF